MGLFDYIKCEYPLPGDAPFHACSLEFQTQSLENELETYRITVDGYLLGPRIYADRCRAFTGTIVFNWSNIVSIGPGICTRRGEAAHSVEYSAVFADGRVVEIHELSNIRQPAADIRKLHTLEKKQQIELLSPEQPSNPNEILIGREVTVAWGGSQPYIAVVRLENAHEIVVQKPGGRFQIIARSLCGTVVFDSLDDVTRFRAGRAGNWNAKQAAFEEEIRAKA